jgi:ufm1-conjugating enzyme 1
MENTKKALSSIPLLKTKAGPRDVDLWPQRLKEEYQSLIQVSVNDILVTHDIYLLIEHLFLIIFLVCSK